MTGYDILKTTHVVSVALAFISFSTRGVWMFRGSALLHTSVARIVPHAIDTILLVSAIGLTFELQQYPVSSGWLTAKVGALVVYIVLGSIALKRGTSRIVRIGAFFGAWLTFFYIVGVALTHNPLIVV
ncbi:MAG: SirB2 family protein [Acidiferrobacterales bacterium]